MFAQGQAVPSAASPDLPDIVVQAERNEEALRRCLATGCPAMDDIKASIAVAEQLFADGAHRDARDLLSESIRRNKSHAPTMPLAVAALYEASATVNEHYGDMDQYRRAFANRVRTIRDNLPVDSTATLVASALLGDMWLSLGKDRQAELAYDAASRDAARLDRPQLSQFIALRVATLQLSRGFQERAGKMLDDLAARPGADEPAVRAASLAVRARLASVRGDDRAFDQAIEGLKSLPASEEPNLIVSYPLAATRAEAARQWRSRFPLPKRLPAGGKATSFADIGFVIGADGRVGEVEVLRGELPPVWLPLVTDQIATRRYAPLNLEPGSPGVLRVERYSLRGRFSAGTGSFIRTRGPAEEFTVVDLTSRYAPKPGAAED